MAALNLPQVITVYPKRSWHIDFIKQALNRHRQGENKIICRSSSQNLVSEPDALATVIDKEDQAVIYFEDIKEK